MGPPGCRPGGTYSSTKLPDDGDKRRCSLAKLDVISTSLRNSVDRAAIDGESGRCGLSSAVLVLVDGGFLLGLSGWWET